MMRSMAFAVVARAFGTVVGAPIHRKEACVTGALASAVARIPGRKFLCMSGSTESISFASLDEAKSELKKRSKAGSVRHVVNIVETLDATSDSEVYRIAIRGLLRANRGDLAIKLYQQRLDAANLDIELPLAANVLKQCRRLNDVDTESRIFDEIERETEAISDEPDTGRILTGAPYLGICNALLAAGDLEGVLKGLRLLVRASQTNGFIPADAPAYNDSIRRFGKERFLEAIFLVLDAMRAAKVDRTNETFEFLAQAAVKSVEFVTGAVSMDTLPDPLNEVAFIGRSNVGKSSLVNMVVARKAIAHTSKRPGKTQQFNYFIVNKDSPQQFFLVDLPGVGYAKVPKAVQAQWMHFMNQYFDRRPSLRVLFHLVDGRHGALEDDEALMHLVSSSSFMKTGKFVIVLTKMDKMDKQRAKQRVLDSVRGALVRNGCPANVPIIQTSAETRQGRDDMWRFIRLALGLS